MKDNEPLKLLPTDSCVVQTMEIANRLWFDIMHRIYQLDGLKVNWGFMPDGCPAFQYSIADTTQNLHLNDHFVENFLITKSVATHAIDVDKKIMAFQGLMGVSTFMRDFVTQHKIIPDTQINDSAPSKKRMHDFISHTDLLALKEPFYISVEQCMEKADQALNGSHKKTALFIHSVEELEKSVQLENIKSSNTEPKYATSDVFHFH